MKLFNNALGLVLLFLSSASATITIEHLPPVVRAGSYHDVKCSSDRNYTIDQFLVMHWDDSESSVKPLGGIIDHFINMSAGDSTSRWKVPAVKNGVFNLWISAIEIDNQGEPNPDATFYVNSNKFEITGGPALYPKEIAGVVIGTVLGFALFIGIWVIGARLLRKRRSLVVDLFDGNEGGCTSVAGR